nr:hypothetical protein Itr_chr11CG18170 [Ipomoea trifida]
MAAIGAELSSGFPSPSGVGCGLRRRRSQRLSHLEAAGSGGLRCHHSGESDERQPYASAFPSLNDVWTTTATVESQGGTGKPERWSTSCSGVLHTATC